MRRAIIAMVTVAALSRPAAADRRSVGLATPDPELQRAVSVALVPWQIRVVPVDGAELGGDMPRSADRARELGAAAGVGAVVWISTDDTGDSALWIYDVDDDHVVARKLGSSPPLDEVTAAAAALSVKTLLRHSAVAPAPERYGAESIERRAVPTRLHFESSLGARLRSGDSGTEPRLGLGIGWWAHPRIAASVVLRSGPGVAVDEASFVGRFTDTAVGLGARVHLELGASVSLHPEAVAALHITALDGAVLAPDEPAHIGRVNPAAELAAIVEWRALPELSVGVRLGGAFLLRKQRYLVRGEPVFVLPSTEWSAALVLRTRLF